jgi:hypothetical protein
MRFKVNFLKLAIFSGLFLFLFPMPAFAYLDPGGISSFLQLFLAGLVGALFAFKNIFFRIKTFFIKIFFKNKTSE